MAKRRDSIRNAQNYPYSISYSITRKDHRNRSTLIQTSDEKENAEVDWIQQWKNAKEQESKKIKASKSIRKKRKRENDDVNSGPGVKKLCALFEFTNQTRNPRITLPIIVFPLADSI